MGILGPRNPTRGARNRPEQEGKVLQPDPNLILIGLGSEDMGRLRSAPPLVTTAKAEGAGRARGPPQRPHARSAWSEARLRGGPLAWPAPLP